MEAKWKKFSKEQLQDLANQCKSVREFAIKLGYSPIGGGSMATVKKVIREQELNTSHFLGQSWNKNNFDYTRFKKGQVIKATEALPALSFLRGRKCEQCGLERWLDQNIPLEIHHIDGDKLNNEMDNLQILCPNCHALTANWRGKNIKSNERKKIISEEDFVETLKNSPSIRQALLKLGLSGKGGNYDRAHQLIIKYNITKFLKED